MLIVEALVDPKGTSMTRVLPLATITALNSTIILAGSFLGY